MIVFIGQAGLDRRQKRAVALALAYQARPEQADRVFSVIPVLLPGADLAPAFQFTNAWIDLRRDPADPLALADLARNLREGAPRRPITVMTGLCPYRGLLPFREEDAAFFFGREREAERLLEAVQARNPVILIGPAGSGKTSLIQAGLWPRLRRRPGAAWEMALFTPGSRPFDRLAAALLPWLKPQAAGNPAEVRRLGYQLAAGQVHLTGLIEASLAGSPEADRFLLVVDQFEELFSLTPAAERQVVATALFQAMERAPLSLLLGLQADFYGQAMTLSPELGHYLEQGAFNLGSLAHRDLEKAMLGPTRPLTLAFEPDLASRILDAADRLPAPLPLLQFTLAELWRQQQGGLLSQAAYDRIGQIEGAITYRAEAIFSRFSARQQQLASNMLLRLLSAGPAGEAMGRSAKLADLSASLAAQEHEQRREVIEALVQAGLLRQETDPVSGEMTIALAGPALIEQWPRLHHWARSQQELWLWRGRLQPVLAGWEQAERNHQDLLSGPALIEASQWLAERPARLEAAERAYVYRSLAGQDRQRDLNGLAGLLIVTAGLVVIVLLAVQAVVQRDLALAGLALAESGRQAAEAVRATAEADRQTAEQQRRLALAHQLVAQARLKLDSAGPEAAPATLLALESLRLAPSAEAEQALRQGLTLLPWRVEPAAGEPGMTYKPEGRWLIASSRQETGRVWTGITGQEMLQVGNWGWVFGAVFSPDGRWLATSSQRSAQLWRFGSVTGYPAVRVQEVAWLEHTTWVNSTAFSPDSRWLATASADGTARLWLAATGQPVARFWPGQAVEIVAFSPDNRWLATKSGNRVWLWPTAIIRSGSNEGRLPEIHSGQEAFQLEHDNWINAMAFSPDGYWLATASADGTARVWETATGQEVARLVHAGEVYAVTFSPDGRWLATGSADHTVRLWLPATARELARLAHNRPVTMVTFSPDGRYLATKSGASVQVWSLVANNAGQVTAQPVITGLRLEDPVRSLVFSPDNRWLAIATGDPPGSGLVQVWEMATGRQLLQSEAGYWMRAAIFSPDGRWLVTGGGDRILRIWPLWPEDLMAEACARLTRNLSSFEWQQYLGDEPYHATCPSLSLR